MKIIEAEGINKFFGTGQNRVHVLKDMSFAIEEGDFVAIIGQSGSGKSMLMSILGCLDTQSSGVCRIGGVDIGTLDSDELAELRGKRIGLIFQRYNLLSTLSATENVALPAVYSGVEQGAPLPGQVPARGSGPAGQAGEQAQRAFRRPAAARFHRPGAHERRQHHPCRRTHRRARLQKRRERHGHPHRAEQAGAHHHRRDPRPPHRGLCQPGHRNQGRFDHFRHPEPGIRPRAGTGQPPRSPRASFLFRKDQFVEAFKMSVQAILAHKMRSVLTMLGIIIGIASVVSVVALGRGSQERDHRQHQLDGHKHHQRLSRARLRRP